MIDWSLKAGYLTFLPAQSYSPQQQYAPAYVPSLEQWFRYPQNPPPYQRTRDCIGTDGTPSTDKEHRYRSNKDPFQSTPPLRWSMTICGILLHRQHHCAGIIGTADSDQGVVLSGEDNTKTLLLVCSQRSSPVFAAYMLRLGHFLYPYLDDWPLVVPSYYCLLLAQHLDDNLFTNLGVCINEKFTLIATRDLTFIGTHLNSHEAQAFLHRERVPRSAPSSHSCGAVFIHISDTASHSWDTWRHLHPLPLMPASI